MAAAWPHGNSATEVPPLLVHQKNSPGRGENGLVDGDGEKKNVYLEPNVRPLF